MNTLIIGGTRNIGYYLTLQLLAAGHRVTLLNRGITRDELPPELPRLRCDRTDPHQLRRALSGRAFDVVVDTTLYKGDEAEVIADILNEQVGHYIFLSTGQVYLVRQGLSRPFKEADYNGAIISAPEINTYDYEEYLYGFEKRQAEDALAAAYHAQGFPYTSLRLPMVNGERDTMHRLYGYMLRIKDGGPVLVPDAPNYSLRHVYTQDVVQAIMRVIDHGDAAKGKAYNIAQDETLSLEVFLGMIGDLVGIAPRIIAVERELLVANGFMPDCSPFSDRWMSELDNTLSKQALGMVYTPAATYLAQIIAYYHANPMPIPNGYKRRQSEKQLVTV
ncbi:MAG: NAD-dependent epimerase/dehydratase family protein [Armatimonadetes bacterium]|nr:NAD-dependent epimerase/dehydratase family protein [Anaerolineae bacterium]